MVAVMIGGTGLTGSILLRKLLADVDIVQVVSVSRRSVGLDHPRLVEVLITDLDELPAQAARLKGDIYFSCLGTTLKAAGSREKFYKVDHDAVVTFASLAKTHGARCFTLISATGADPRSAVFYNRVKGAAEVDVKSLGLNRLLIFRPGLLLGPRSEVRLVESLAAGMFALISPLLPSALRDRMVTQAEVLADCMWREGKKINRETRIIAAVNICRDA